MDKPNFKNKSGAYILQGLFLETSVYNRENLAIYTFQREDVVKNGTTYKSIFKAYIEESDPTEYTFACKYFDSWAHWEMICRSQGCADWIDKMRSELNVKIRSEAVKQIIEHSQGSKGYPAAKWLAEKGWGKKVGRPTKKQKSAEEVEEQQIADAVKEDAENAGIQVN